MKGLNETFKRIIDFSVALLSVIVLSPLFIFVGVMIRLDSKGSTFFRQERLGRDGSTFRIFKFRTMIAGAYRSGARLTVKRDPRITKVGHLLRWTKVDELPQLFNVVLGDMSMVGPRPEDPYFCNFYSEEQRKVLSVRPGMVGPSQIDGRDEVEQYPEGTEDTETYYIEHILPDKLTRDLQYVNSATLWDDIKYLFHGALSVAFSQIKADFLSRSKSRLALLSLDLVLMIACYILANFIHFDWQLPPQVWPYIFHTLFWIVILKPPVLIYYGIYQRSTRWIGRHDMAAIVKGVSVGSALVVAVTYFTGLQRHSRAVFIVDWALLTFMMTSLRYVLRHILAGASRVEDNTKYVKVLVAGSGHGGESILRSLLEDPGSRFMPVGIIDHEPHRWGALIHGVKVMGGATDIAMAASTHGVQMVLVALADLDPAVVRDITEACEKLNMDYRLIPALSDLLVQHGPEPLSRPQLSPESSL